MVVFAVMPFILKKLCDFHGIIHYRDQSCFSMNKHLLDPEDGVETQAWKVRVLKTPRGLEYVNVSENKVW